MTLKSDAIAVQCDNDSAADVTKMVDPIIDLLEYEARLEAAFIAAEHVADTMRFSRAVERSGGRLSDAFAAAQEAADAAENSLEHIRSLIVRTPALTAPGLIAKLHHAADWHALESGCSHELDFGAAVINSVLADAERFIAPDQAREISGSSFEGAKSAIFTGAMAFLEAHGEARKGEISTGLHGDRGLVLRHVLPKDDKEHGYGTRHGLEIYSAGRRVFEASWDDPAAVDVAIFWRGAWEDELLALPGISLSTASEH